MNLAVLASCLAGELRGYRRLHIRREVMSAERLSRDELARRADVLLQAHVHRSIARFPLYAEAVRRHRGSLPRPAENVNLEELPIWTRHDQRALFAAQPAPDDALYVHQTGGSTGQPVRFHVTRASFEWRTAVMERAYSWAGAEEGRPSFHIWGAPHASWPLLKRAKRSAHLLLQRRRYFDADQPWTDAVCDDCCRLINHTRPEAIVSFTGRLVELARYARDHPKALRWRPTTIMGAAEGLLPGQRELIETQLGARLLMTYGSREFMNIGTECEHRNGYHLNIDNLVVEVVDESGQPLAPGDAGQVAITDLHNAANPFIRWEVGDRGTIASPDEPCPCGRPFPRLQSVDGRLQDVVHTPEGATVAFPAINRTMYEFDWLEGYQFVQPSRHRLTVRLLSRTAVTSQLTEAVTARLRARLGDTIAIDYEPVKALERLASGKVALVISSVEGD
jgi:phenylacetate-CoA ligase